MSDQPVSTQKLKLNLSPKDIIFRYIKYLPWVIISISIALLGAYVKLRYSTPIYNVAGKLLVSNNTMNGGGGDKFDDIFMMQRTDKLGDEIEVIKSRNMAARVARSLHMQKQMYNKGKIRSTVLHSSDEPFNFLKQTIGGDAAGFSLLVTIIN